MKNIIDIINNIQLVMIKNSKTLSTVESCTGGIVASSITEISGSSNWFDRGFITYSNQSKIDLVSVHQSTLDKYGAVSEETAKEMAIGCLQNSNTDFSLSITGIAGPNGGTTQKPVGMVCFSWAKIVNKSNIEIILDTRLFKGDRYTVRQQASLHSLSYLYKFINESN